VRGATNRSGKANAAILRKMPLGMLLLLFLQSSNSPSRKSWYTPRRDRVRRRRRGRAPAAGRATTNDLLDAEATLHDQSTREQLARPDVLESWIAWDLATGALSFRQR
jgi:hypothetical protein